MRGTRLELAAVRVAFGPRTVIERLDLTIEPGECVALVGPSGAGKTTLLRLFSAAVVPQSGSVRVDGTDLASLAPAQLKGWRARVGFVHQDLCLVPNVSVIQNVLSGRLGRLGLWSALRYCLVPPRADLAQARAILQRVGIGERWEERTDQLSGGQRQRVALARALFQEPSILLADEPVSSVDPARAQDMVRLLVELAREQGLSLIVSIHDLALARAHFPRLVGMRDGRVLFDRAPQALQQHELDELYRLKADHGTLVH